MAIDRHGAGLLVVRICLGVFLIFQGLGKLRWVLDTSMLSGQLAGWMQHAAPGSVSLWYLERIAIPGTAVFARLVPLGEIGSGLALLLGIWTPLVAFIAFFMALNFQIASGAVFTYGFLTSGYGLPVLGGTLALTLAGRLPGSIRS